jgi:hypothetical protein
MGRKRGRRGQWVDWPEEEGPVKAEEYDEASFSEEDAECRKVVKKKKFTSTENRECSDSVKDARIGSVVSKDRSDTVEDWSGDEDVVDERSGGPPKRQTSGLDAADEEWRRLRAKAEETYGLAGRKRFRNLNAFLRRLALELWGRISKSANYPSSIAKAENMVWHDLQGRNNLTKEEVCDLTDVIFMRSVPYAHDHNAWREQFFHKRSSPDYSKEHYDRKRRRMV